MSGISEVPVQCCTTEEIKNNSVLLTALHTKKYLIINIRNIGQRALISVILNRGEWATFEFAVEEMMTFLERRKLVNSRAHLAL